MQIENNFENYDFNQIYKLLVQLERDIQLCVKTDDIVLAFYKNKKFFRAIPDLKNFSKDKLRYSPKETKRANIELELTKISTSKNLKVNNLKELLGTIIERPKGKIEIKDQTTKWLTLTSEQLKEEINDLKKYPDVQSLKKAAASILNTNEKRLRKRDKIINIILEKISEEKARVHFGR